MSEKLKPNTDIMKVFNDCIHGLIEIPDICLRIIDTPEFQRLRDIKQLGGCFWVFPGATHTRFEHSLGVCHLAGKMVRHLQRTHANIDYIDIYCLEIAALCHDLGHGPFSHLFDGLFLPNLSNSEWTHEIGSIEMLDHILSTNISVKNVFHEYGLKDVDIVFIMELIAGGPLNAKFYEKYGISIIPDALYQGRENSKQFLYQIVNNHLSGIDVDKWDYFARDSHYLGIKNNFDHNRIIANSKIIHHNHQYIIGYRDKEAKNLYDMFYIRDLLHRRVYRHNVSVAVELMICDALTLANDHILFNGKKLSNVIHDMPTYAQLSDYIFYQILHSKTLELENARLLLKRIQTRSLYKYVGRIQLSRLPNQNIKDLFLLIKSQLINGYNDTHREHISPEDVGLYHVDLNYGMLDRNPLENVIFFTKENEIKKIEKSEVSKMLPNVFNESIIKMYFKSESLPIFNELKKFCDHWINHIEFDKYIT